jgi:copper oxidase (laccase) domain-containing protein
VPIAAASLRRSGRPSRGAPTRSTTAFLARFTAANPEYQRFFSAGKAGRHQFDLEAFVLSRLSASGVTRVEALGLDTYSDPDRFYSYRRATHRGEPDYGRQISLIALPHD